ncbi:MAG: MBL fold metallo-hydrolase [Candidatus Micrarchaeia archaeon]|jgi:L-ascorbate metabolism protein UlaG (beta-lactamase superfamily)
MASITYLGHSCFEIDLGGKIILTDPWFDQKPRQVERLVPPAVSAERIKHADAIFISSDAFDHFDQHDVSILVEGTFARVIAPDSALARLDLQDKYKVAAVECDSFEYYGMQIDVIPVRNNVPGSVGYKIKAGGKSVYFSGDTYDFYGLANVEADVAIIPIGGTQTMDILSAVSAAKKMRVKYVIPCHYNTFSRIKADPEDFARRVSHETKAKPVVLEVGQTANF